MSCINCQTVHEKMHIQWPVLISKSPFKSKRLNIEYNHRAQAVHNRTRYEFLICTKKKYMIFGVDVVALLTSVLTLYVHSINYDIFFSIYMYFIFGEKSLLLLASNVIQFDCYEYQWRNMTENVFLTHPIKKFGIA